MADSSYWVVKVHVFAFETKEGACDYRDRFMDVFCAMPESDGYGASWRVVEEKYEENSPLGVEISPDSPI